MSKLHTTIRAATEADAASIAEIYNEAVLNSTATFDTEPKSVEERQQWLRSHDERHPVLVVESEGTVVGWASLTSWSERCAYEGTAEVSVYIHKNFRGKGIGNQIMKQLVEAAKKAGFHCLLARIADGNPQSIHIHEKFGFRTVGVMHQVGFKFGRFRDVTLMEKILEQK